LLPVKAAASSHTLSLKVFATPSLQGDQVERGEQMLVVKRSPIQTHSSSTDLSVGEANPRKSPPRPSVRVIRLNCLPSLLLTSRPMAPYPGVNTPLLQRRNSKEWLLNLQAIDA
jgi:hypothetical protein